MRFFTLILLVVLAIIIELSPLQARAALGETLSSDSSLKAENTKLKARSLKTSQSTLYSVHEMVVGLNTIREYTNADGVVFAVTWKGQSHPDLEALFGSYYSEYQSADSNKREIRAKGATHGGVMLKTERMAIRRGGHMRALQGSAIVPSLVPAGVVAEALP